MKINLISAFLLAGIVSGNAIAAEDASGVLGYMDKTIASVKLAQAAAQKGQGNKDDCVNNIKEAKQHYKQLTGDAAGVDTQNAIKLVKEAQELCGKDTSSDMSAAVSKLGDATKLLENVKSKLKN